MSRQQITEGAILRIQLPCGKYGYGKILINSSYAFYDLISTEPLEDLEKITTSKILFLVAVHKYAVTSGRWSKIGKMPIEDRLKKMPLKFMVDPLRPNYSSLYDPNTGEIKPAKKEECIGLERAAVWEAEHIEGRICDHYAGKPNIWVEKMKLPD